MTLTLTLSPNPNSEPGARVPPALAQHLVEGLAAAAGAAEAAVVERLVACEARSGLGLGLGIWLGLGLGLGLGVGLGLAFAFAFA